MAKKAKKTKRAAKPNNGANLGFENRLWEMADKMRGHMDAGEYKHVVLGLIFLKYISDAFRAKFALCDQFQADVAAAERHAKDLSTTIHQRVFGNHHSGD